MHERVQLRDVDNHPPAGGHLVSTVIWRGRASASKATARMSETGPKKSYKSQQHATVRVVSRYLNLQQCSEVSAVQGFAVLFAYKAL